MAFLAALVVPLLGTTTPADAASPPITTQAAAANAAFLAYAPPPAGGAKALCLVDTGVNPTPDTTPGLVSATALDGGTPTDVDPLWHGTIDAAIAGGAGHGVLGAWPQLKIVSVRATDAPSPGQTPTFQFDDYGRGITRCSTDQIPGVHIVAIALPLASVILPTPDQAQAFDDAVVQAHAKGMSILSASGNDPGPIQLPGSQPGVMPVGAGDPSNGICPFSATTGLTFFAPGCGVDQIDTQGQAFCCGNGSSQASAFTAAVVVALRSYKPELTAAQAVQQLVSTSRNGHLDVASAFRAAGLETIIDAGTVAIPKPPLPPAIASSPAPATRPVPRPTVKSATWRRGILQITLKSIPKRARLHAKIIFANRKPLYVGTPRRWLRVRAPAPRRLQLRLSRGNVSSATLTVKVTRLRR
ncbi:MAG TPA: S8/S53 family peptidase [Solirubrobacteraceae bacterium]|jgi:hypothetical protein|nr:S8/S53 family peptidase [Solirubrobacteraceae bacterium]